jgi:hypothetical protein
MKTRYYRTNIFFELFVSIFYTPIKNKLIVIYATSFCVNWAFLIARRTRRVLRARGQLEGFSNCPKDKKGFKGSRAIRKAQFSQKRVAYKILLFETTDVPEASKSFKTNFSRPVRNVTLNVLSRATVCYLSNCSKEFNLTY